MGRLIFEHETYLIRGVCFEIYEKIGFCHKEIVYQKALEHKLKNLDLLAEREKRISIYLDGKVIGVYQPDFIIENKIILEIKAKYILIEEDIKQFWYYLKNTNYQLGLLINFGKPNGVQIIRRIYTH